MNYIPDYNESKHNYLRKTVCYKQDLKHHTMPFKLSQGHLLNDFNTKKNGFKLVSINMGHWDQTVTGMKSRPKDKLRVPYTCEERG